MECNDDSGRIFGREEINIKKRKSSVKSAWPARKQSLKFGNYTTSTDNTSFDSLKIIPLNFMK